MARDSDRRRLAYILSDENYGPKLARLRGAEERRILDLISENRGKDARQAILEADENRRAKVRERSAARRAQQRGQAPYLSVRTRRQQERDAAEHILDVFGGKAKPESVWRNVGYMTGGELDFAADADENGLVSRAVVPADRKDVRGKDLNPFWYH